MQNIAWSLSLLILTACAAGCGPPKAPSDIDSNTRFLYRVWPQMDPQPTADGLNNLIASLTPLDLVHNLDARAFALTSPAPEDLTAINWPMDRKPSNTLGSSVARKIWTS